MQRDPMEFQRKRPRLLENMFNIKKIKQLEIKKNT